MFDTPHIDIVMSRLSVADAPDLFGQLSDTSYIYTHYPKQYLIEKFCAPDKALKASITDGVALCDFQSPNIHERVILLATLDRPLRSNEISHEPFDIICLLLSPETNGPVHLRTLSRLSRLLLNQTLCAKIRECNDPETIRMLFENPEGWLLAA